MNLKNDSKKQNVQFEMSLVVFIRKFINCNKCINNYFYKRVNINDLFIIECLFCIVAIPNNFE